MTSKNEYGTNYIGGISSCIYLPNLNNKGDYKIKLIGGNISRNKDIKINENTMFDVASITKLYLLLLLFKLEELGIINLNDKIVDLNPKFKGLEDFTFNDLIRLHGELRTNGNVAKATTYEEAYDMLKSIYLISNSREENKYTDFGAIVISDTLEEIFSRNFDKPIKFEDIMNEYLLKPLNLNSTMFKPNSNNVSGNGNNGNIVHDSKAKILGGAVGSAGIFTTSDDLARLARNLYSVNYINKDYISRFGEITFPNSSQAQKGNLGIYVKHPLGFDKTFTPSEFSNGSFSHQGWTGALATFDPNNLIHQNILVDAIYENENSNLVKNDKPVGYGAAFDEYLAQITSKTMLMYVVKQYYNKYCNEQVKIDDVKFIK